MNQQNQFNQSSNSQEPGQDLQPEHQENKTILPKWTFILIVLLTVIIFGLISYGIYSYFISQDGNISMGCQRENLVNGFSRDCNFAYYNNEKITDSHGPSFEILKYGYQSIPKDKNHVYLTSGGYMTEGPDPLFIPIRVEIVQGIDAPSFELLNEYYSRDKNFGYRVIQKIEQSDGSTFEVLGNKIYAKDKNNVYWYGEIIPGADTNTFTYLGESKKFNYAGTESNLSYTKDVNNVYMNGEKIITTIDPLTFTVLEDGYTKDQNNVYYDNKIIPGADPKSFEIITADTVIGGDPIKPQHRSLYSRDAQKVYYLEFSFANKNGQIIEVVGADPNSFERTPGYKYDARDKNSYFSSGKLIKSID